VASLVEADLLVILSDVDGLYDADPRNNPNAKRIGTVPRIDASVVALAGGAGSQAGTGGMVTKIEAARKAVATGIPTVIAQGKEHDVLSRILAGVDIGTLFQSAADRLASRKHWIAFALKPQGKVRLDEGAAKAVRQSGRSLLPSGVREVEGKFGRGDSISICDASGNEFARGLTEYANDEIRAILGKKSTEIEAVLGYKYSDEIVHRDDLVLLERQG
jgi:glutamate 5-kinase